MRAEITLEEVSAAEADLLEAKKTGKVDQIREAKAALVPLRQAYRLQEEAAGRRSLVGGDARKVGG